MKKILSIFVIVLMGCICPSYAQYQHMFSDYDPVQTNRSMQQGNEGQLVYGYCRTKNGLKRVKIKVAQYTTMGISSIYVIGYFTPTYGGSGTWSSCRDMASSVNLYTDGEYIVNNFDYKCNVGTLGTVYF